MGEREWMSRLKKKYENGYVPDRVRILRGRFGREIGEFFINENFAAALLDMTRDEFRKLRKRLIWIEPIDIGHSYFYQKSLIYALQCILKLEKRING